MQRGDAHQLGQGVTYSASSLEICFPECKTSATIATMGSRFRLAAAVTKPSLKGKAEERGSAYVAHQGSIPVAPWLEASCALEGSGQGGWYCRVHRDLWQFAWHCWKLGTEPGSSEAEGEEMCPRLPAQMVPSLKLVLLFPALLWFSLKPVL